VERHYSSTVCSTLGTGCVLYNRPESGIVDLYHRSYRLMLLPIAPGTGVELRDATQWLDISRSPRRSQQTPPQPQPRPQQQRNQSGSRVGRPRIIIITKAVKQAFRRALRDLRVWFGISQLDRLHLSLWCGSQIHHGLAELHFFCTLSLPRLLISRTEKRSCSFIAICNILILREQRSFHQVAGPFHTTFLPNSSASISFLPR